MDFCSLNDIIYLISRNRMLLMKFKKIGEKNMELKWSLEEIYKSFDSDEFKRD